MSTAMFDKTEEIINKAQINHDITGLEKETNFVMNQIIVSMLTVFKDRIKGITFEAPIVEYNSRYLEDPKSVQILLKWINRLKEFEQPMSDLMFGKMKLDLEKWYYQVGGTGIYFSYQEDYLIKPSEAAELLGVSKVTFNKFVKQGFEVVDTTAHNKVPKHAVVLWKDPVYAVKTQMLHQDKKIRNQTPSERFSDVTEELAEFKAKYKVRTSAEAFANINIEALDDPSDYYAWRDLEDEESLLLNAMNQNLTEG